MKWRVLIFNFLNSFIPLAKFCENIILKKIILKSIFVKIAAQRTAESALKSSSGWVTLDSAESLFLTSKDRVFSALEETTAKKSKPEKAHGIEENPKWNIISEILGEIRDEMKAS